MAFGSRTVARRDVEFNVNLGQFKAQLGEAGAVYARTTNSMSTEALRTSVAQEKVNRAVARFGPESIQARQATVALRHDMESLATASHAGSRAILAEERALGRFSRGALAAVGVSSELKRALLLGSGSFLAGVGVAAVFKESISAAKEEEVALGQLDIALRNTGNARAENKRKIEEELAAQVKSTAFTNTELTTSLAVFIRRFGDVNKALEANAIAADVARAKNVSLADAQTLILRASFGNPRSLRILGIELNKTTANYDALRSSTKHASAEQIAAAKAADVQANELSALDQVQAKYHGNAARFLTTTAGKQALFNAELNRSKEIIGAALLPEFNHLLSRLANYLDKMNRTGRLQRDVNKAVRESGHVFHDLGVGVHAIEAVLGPVDRALGGLKHTVELLTLALVAFKTRGVTSFVTGTTEIEAAAAGAGLAGAGTSSLAARVAAYTGGAGAGAAGFAAGRKGLNLGPLILAQILSDLAPNPPSTPRNHPHGFATHLPFGIGKAVTYGQYLGDAGSLAIIDAIFGKRGVPGGSIDPFRPNVFGEGPLGLGALLDGRRRDRHVFPGTAYTGKPGKTGRGAQIIAGLTEKQGTALLRAEGTKGTADDLKALTTQRSELDKLLRQKGLKPADLNNLLSQRNSVQDQIDSIVQGDAQAAAERARKAKAKFEAAARKKKEAERARNRAIVAALTHTESGLKDALEKARLTDSNSDDVKAAKALEAFYKRESHDDRLTRAMRDAFKAKDIREKVGIHDLLKGKKTDAGANIREFIAAYTAVTGDYASNYGFNSVTKPGGGNTIINHQHFQAPTTDRHREAKMARFAMQSAFDS